MKNEPDRRGITFKVAPLPLVCTGQEAELYRMFGTTPNRLEDIVTDASKAVRARGLLMAFMAHTDPDTWRLHPGTMTPDKHDADTVLYGAASTTRMAGAIASVRISLGPLFFNPHHVQSRGSLAVVSTAYERSSVLTVRPVNFNEVLEQGWRSNRDGDSFLRVFDHTRDGGSQSDSGFYPEGRFSLQRARSPDDSPAADTNKWLMSLLAATVTGSA